MLTTLSTMNELIKGVKNAPPADMARTSPICGPVNFKYSLIYKVKIGEYEPSMKYSRKYMMLSLILIEDFIYFYSAALSGFSHERLYPD